MSAKKENKKISHIPPAVGRILISEPLLQDFYFRRSVVLLADHSDEGTFGLILNKPVDVRFNDVIKGFPNFHAPLYLGGPVQTSNLYFIHTLGDKIEGSMKILDGLYWGGDIEQIKEMMTLDQLNPSNIRFFIGYAGWVSKQLDRELDENSWVVSSASTEQLILANPDNLWRDIVRTLGKDFVLWANYPPDPLLN
ncbi:MAG: YqgE/AlgH family protein [Bacteroidales bacterium]|nr:YqgE/AlgH family protein [Bacteroidales bacterium]